MLIEQPRFLLRDFTEADRAAFLAYQMDPLYLALYDFEASNIGRPNALFDLFREWSQAAPRCNFQIGIFDRRNGEMCGCAGLRKVTDDTAILGIELAPAKWGQFALALDVAAAVIDYGFNALQLEAIVGDTASGNKRVAKLARWFGAKLVAEREGPGWMSARGYREVDWALDRMSWQNTARRRRRNSGTGDAVFR